MLLKYTTGKLLQRHGLVNVLPSSFCVLGGSTVIVGRAQAVVSGLAVSTEIVGRFQVSVLGSKLPNYIVIVVGMMTRSPFTVAMST